MNGHINYTDLRALRTRNNNFDYHNVYHNVYPTEYTDLTDLYDGNITKDNYSIKKPIQDFNLDAECIDKYPPYGLRGRLNGIGTRVYMETMKNIGSEKIWINDPMTLFKINGINDIFPKKGQTKIEQLNNLMKMGLYTSIIFMLVNWDRKYILIAVIVAIVTLFLNANNISMFPENKRKNNKDSKIDNVNTNINQNNNPDINRDINSDINADINADIKNDANINIGAKKSISGEENALIENTLKEIEKEKRRKTRPSPIDYYATEVDKYTKIRGKILPYRKEQIDKIVGNKSQNETSAGYDWVKASSHVDYRLSNNNLQRVNPIFREKMYSDVNEASGREMAERNTLIPAHARDVTNINPAELFYGKNLDRKLYYSSH